MNFTETESSSEEDLLSDTDDENIRRSEPPKQPGATEYNADTSGHGGAKPKVNATSQFIASKRGLPNAAENQSQVSTQQQVPDQSQGTEQSQVEGYPYKMQHLPDQPPQASVQPQPQQRVQQNQQQVAPVYPNTQYLYTHKSWPAEFATLKEMETRKFHIRRQMPNTNENFGFWYKIHLIREGQFAVARTCDRDSNTPDMVKIISTTMCLRYQSDDVTKVLKVGDFVQMVYETQEKTQIATHITALCMPVTQSIYFGQISEMDNQRIIITCPQYAKISPNKSYLFHYYILDTERFGNLKFCTVIFRGEQGGMYVEGWSLLRPRFDNQIIYNVDDGYEYIDMTKQERASNHFTLEWHKTSGQKEFVFMVKNVLMEVGFADRGDETRDYFDRDWVNWLKSKTNGFLTQLVPSIPVDKAANKKCRNKYTMGKFTVIE